jgi:hypothetical protein
MSEPTTNRSTKCPNLLPIRAQNVQTYSQSEPQNVRTYCQSEPQNVRSYSQAEHKMSEPTANQSHKMSEPTANQSTKCPNLLPIRAQNVQTYCQSEYKINIYFFLLVNEFQNKNSNILIRIFHHILIV